MLTCIHNAADQGLCPACQEEYESDPGAYLEYGPHPAGMARWKLLLEELELLPPEVPGVTDDDIPF